MIEFTDRKDGSTTWMLFESGNGVVVDLSLYSPSRDKTRPIDAYVVTECEGDFTGSARRAAEAVYDVVRRQGAEIAPVVVGYDLQGFPGGRRVMGESGGLAFAIALAKRVHGRDPGPVAATGEVKSGHGGGPVGPVRGIEAKVAAAGRLVPEKGWVLYPEENDREISGELRESLREKGLRLQPVSSVAEALSLLFDSSTAQLQKVPSPVKSKIALGKNTLVSALVLVTALLIASICGWPPFGREISLQVSDPVQNRLQEGVTDEKNSGESNGTASTSLTEPVLSPGPRMKIELSGSPGIAWGLAQLTTEKLMNLLETEQAINPKIIRITGLVVIENISKMPRHNKGVFGTRMTVAVKELTFDDGKRAVLFPVLSVTVKGKGSERILIPKAASVLARKIVNKSRLRESSGKEEIVGRGFD